MWKVFAQRQNKYRHEQFKCADNPNKAITKSRCNSCGQEFGRKDVLLKHENKKRCKGTDPVKRNTCEKCGKEFLRPSHLKRHEVVHEHHEFHCETCGPNFK